MKYSKNSKLIEYSCSKSSFLSENILLKELILGIAATLCLTLASQISFFLPFTPVPITLAPQGPLLVALMLSPKRAFLWTLNYIVMGFLGAPVFAGFFAGFGVTSGYILGYPLCALFASSALRFLKSLRALPMVKYLFAYISFALATMLIYIPGVALLKLSLSLSLATALHIGVYPFLIGCLFVKIPLCTALLMLQSRADTKTDKHQGSW